MPNLEKLSRREKQVLETLYRLGEASAKDIQAELPDAPGNSSVRTHLRNLVKKGYANCKEKEFKYLYCPSKDIEEISRSALAEVVDTFFKGEPALAVNQLLNCNLDEISDEDLADIENLIKDHRNQKNE